MKYSIVAILLILNSNFGFSQDSKYSYQARETASVKKETLIVAESIQDLDPEFCRHLMLPYRAQYHLDQLLNRKKFFVAPTLAGNPSPSESGQKSKTYLQHDFEQLVAYELVSISAQCAGKIMTAQSHSPKLTSAQKTIIQTADPDTDIKIKIKFRYKNQVNQKFEGSTEFQEGEFSVLVVPQKEASYLGGAFPMASYFEKNITTKISDVNPKGEIQQTLAIFTVNELGQIVNSEISETSTNPKIDQIILEAIRKMPRWKPAENSKGMKVKQAFRFRFGGYGC
jgi:hypothetical protein